MNAVNAVKLFVLVWTFTAVCQADKDISTSCDNVNGSVGKKVTFTCSVSLQCPNCSIQNYMFQYPEIPFNDTPICKQENYKVSCEERNSFTCSYNPTTAMTESFRFFLQTTCGMKTTKFSVNIADSLLIKAEDPEAKDTASKDTAIAAAVGCFSFVLIIIIMTIICKTNRNFTKPCGFQKRMFLCIRHDEDNTTPPEDVI